MIDLLIWIIVLCLIFGLIYWAMGILPIPAPFKNVALVALIVILILILLSAVTGIVPMPRFK